MRRGAVDWRETMAELLLDAGREDGRTRRPPVLLILGGGLLLILHAAHFSSVLHWAGGGRWNHFAQLVRANMTPLAWCAYLLFAMGLLALWDGRSWLARFWNRFWVCWLWSVPAWCYFDWMNFYFMRDPRTGLRAWEYDNLPPAFSARLAGYLIAFGAIAPGMFLSAEALQRLGFVRLQTPPLACSRHTRRLWLLAVFALGVLLAPIPIVVGGPASNLAIWVGTWALLDPINCRLGRPSIVRDWFDGRWGRTLALGAGGLWCGLLWEFWNYWAWGKWVYHLPFLGSWEHYRYFEMPIPGLIGFIAFGLETWAMWQTSLFVLGFFVEGERGEPADRAIQHYACF